MSAPASGGKKTAHTFQVGDELLTLAEMSERSGIAIDTLRSRIKKKMSPEAAMAAPVNVNQARVARRTLYQFKGAMVSRVDLAAAAGCSVMAMRKRLEHMTPEQAVAAGEKMPEGGAARKAALKAVPTANKPPAKDYGLRLAPDAPTIKLATETKTVGKPAPASRFGDLKPSGLFSSLRPGEYPEESHMAKVYPK